MSAVTYCIAMRLDSGLLFVSDTRTNAGVDNVGTFRKLYVVPAGEDRSFVIQSAGSLATTHEVMHRIDRDLEADDGRESLATVAHLFEAALYLGRLNKEVTAEHVATVGLGASATFILGGQIRGERPDILLVYPEGNYIRASDTLPYHQIGEAKYGKHLLELAARAHLDVVASGKIALASMLSTAHANLSVGPPYDVAVYRNGTFEVKELRLEADHPFLAEIDRTWRAGLLDLIGRLPPIPDDVVTGLA
jgi:putative proteasome-type protease